MLSIVLGCAISSGRNIIYVISLKFRTILRFQMMLTNIHINLETFDFFLLLIWPLKDGGVGETFKAHNAS